MHSKLYLLFNFFLCFSVAENPDQYLNFSPSVESTFAGANIGPSTRNQSDIDTIPPGNDKH